MLVTFWDTHLSCVPYWTDYSIQHQDPWIQLYSWECDISLSALNERQLHKLVFCHDVRWALLTALPFRVFTDFRLCALSLSPGQTPAHDERCLSVGSNNSLSTGIANSAHCLNGFWCLFFLRLHDFVALFIKVFDVYVTVSLSRYGHQWAVLRWLWCEEICHSARTSHHTSLHQISCR